MEVKTNTVMQVAWGVIASFSIVVRNVWESPDDGSKLPRVLSRTNLACCRQGRTHLKVFDLVLF